MSYPKLSIFAFLLIQTSLLCVLDAADKKRSYTNPKEVDADYAIQGEYSGELGADNEKYGMQLIARGAGKFDAYSFSGGLPGDGFDPAADERAGPYKFATKDGVISAEHEGMKAVVKGGALVVTGSSGEALGTLKRVDRKSKTLGKKPEKGAIVLFDGSDAKSWKNGKMTKEGHLLRGTESLKKFQDCYLHMEFRIPYEPFNRGQGRGNSGVYMQRRYEVQIIDSFGEKASHNLCGGIYSIAPPKMNMSYPPLTWQTYDIEFKAAKYDDKGKKTADATMSAWHNGVLVHKDQKLPKRTTASPEGESPSPGAVFFQNHGHVIVFKNIWAIER
tara:strand:- start:610 stop:1602 length:993 start_codon:yes stop_codon:yes gene_type:complete